MEAAPQGLVGVREYARLKGLNPSTVSRQVRSGIIPNRGGEDAPLIDPAEADEARAARLNPLKARQRGGELGYEPALLETRPSGSARTSRSLADVKAEAEALNVEERSIRIAKAKALLCDRPGVERGIAEAGRLLRELLAKRSRTLAEKFAGMTDPREIETEILRADEAMLEIIRNEFTGIAGDASDADVA